jgi:hypothetical protein
MKNRRSYQLYDNDFIENKSEQVKNTVSTRHLVERKFYEAVKSVLDLTGNYEDIGELLYLYIKHANGNDKNEVDRCKNLIINKLNLK